MDLISIVDVESLSGAAAATIAHRHVSGPAAKAAPMAHDMSAFAIAGVVATDNRRVGIREPAP
jgi:hypothetical protein